MKNALTCLFLLLSAIHGSFAQTSTLPLMQDATFTRALLKGLSYPKVAQQEGKVAKVYVGFKVNNQGKITDIEILNASHTDPAFEQIVAGVMSQVPEQNKTYQGDYVLPVKFVLTGTKQTIQPQEESQFFVQSLKKEALLDEVVVAGYR